MANYDRRDLQARVDASRLKFSDYIEQLEKSYEDRERARLEAGIPSLVFCGHGRAGKDTAAMYWCRIIGRPYPGSASQMVLPVIADTIGVSEDEAFRTRHNNREFWFQWCNLFRAHDPSLLVRMCLGKGDVAIGVRSDVELFAVRHQKVASLLVWIENKTVEVDPTVEYDASDCDLTIINNGSRNDLYGRMLKLAHVLKVVK